MPVRTVLVPLLIGTELPCSALGVLQLVRKSVQGLCRGLYGVVGATNVYIAGIQTRLEVCVVLVIRLN